MLFRSETWHGNEIGIPQSCLDGPKGVLHLGKVDCVASF
jgi:hypothetical protein